MTNKIKLIIFDAYGVILKGGYPPTCKYLAKKYGGDWQQYYAVIYTKYFNQAAERKISQTEAWQKAIVELKLPLSLKELKKVHYGFMDLDQQVIQFIERLKKQIKVIMLTKNTRQQLREVNAILNVKKYFPVINTWEYNLPKASTKTLKFLEKKFRVKAQEMIIIDDQESNLVAGKEAGAKTIFYQNFQQFKKEFKKYYV